MRFKDKVVFITGAASGIGKEAAIQFGAEGANLALADWNESAGLTLRNQLESQGIDVRFYKLDVSDYNAVKDCLEQIITDFGRIDIALNNAGIGAKTIASTAESSLDDWDQVIAVNQSGVFYCMKEELKHMTKQSSGSIINISSIAGLRAMPRQIAYVASKHAVIGMTKVASLEYARTGIRINAVCPVFTNSPLLEQLFGAKEELRTKLKNTIPVGRYGEVTDIVNGIFWLADDASSFVTGLCLPIDGGQMA